MPWNLSLFAGCSKIWIERNIRVFNGKSKNVSDVVDVIVWSVSNWVSRDKVFKDVSLHDLHISWEVYFRGGQCVKFVRSSSCWLLRMGCLS